jgi:rod shape-determining protein MreC
MLRKYKYYILLLLLFLSIIFISNISYFIMPNDIDVNSLVDDYTKQLESEYNELLKINEIDYNTNLNITISRTLYRDIYDYHNYITIYKGSNDKINEGMVVVNNFGLVGVISQVDKNNSRVRLITSNESNISVKINESYGILKVSNGSLIVSDLSNYDNISVGDKIYTSGIGNLIGDIYIGEVSNISLNSTNIEKIITVTPAVDFDNLKYIAVISYD